MKKLLFLLLTLFAVNLSAQNQMPLMQTFAGAMANSYFGQNLVSLDFNADGFDDLVVQTSAHTTEMLKVYYGGVILDTIPDLQRSNLGFWWDLTSVGDVNGDGYDDLLYSERINETSGALRFFYGGTSPDMNYDFEIPFTCNGWGDPLYKDIYPLGDVNNDGYDDIGCKRYNSDPNIDLVIILGGSFEIVDVVQHVSACKINGIGDVNGDGIDDFMIGYFTTQNPYPYYPRCRYIYFGSPNLDLNNRLLLMESYEINMTYPGGDGIGDFNGDGFDDMLIYYYPQVNGRYLYIKQGSATLPISTEYALYPDYLYAIDFDGLASGDFNGDGYSDIVGTNFQYAMYEGIAGICLGRAIPNGIADLIISPPQGIFMYQFGWRVTTGDFNGDGYCDMAISAPNSAGGTTWFPGYVYVYAGNAQLADTTVGNDEQVTPPNHSTVGLELYPNPAHSKKTDLRFTLEGYVKNTIKQPVICLYNVKGQLVVRHTLSTDEITSGKGTLYQKSLKPGIYIATLNDDKTRIATTKVTVK